MKSALASDSNALKFNLIRAFRFRGRQNGRRGQRLRFADVQQAMDGARRRRSPRLDAESVAQHARDQLLVHKTTPAVTHAERKYRQTVGRQRPQQFQLRRVFPGAQRPHEVRVACRMKSSPSASFTSRTSAARISPTTFGVPASSRDSRLPL